jgi:hypothetical protein
MINNIKKQFTLENKRSNMKNLIELEGFVNDKKIKDEAQRIENIKNTKLQTKLKTIDEFLEEDQIDEAIFTNEAFTSKLNTIRKNANNLKDFIKKTLADVEFKMFSGNDKFKLFLTDFYGVATESVNEKKAPFPYNLGYNGKNNHFEYAKEIGMAVKDIEGIKDYHAQQARGGKTAVRDLSSRILIGTIGQPEIKDAIVKALKGVDDNIDLKTIKSNYDASDRERSKHEQDNDMWQWEIQKYEDFHSYKRKYGDAPKQDREFTRDHQMEFIDMLAPYSTTQHQLADIDITSLEDFLRYAADHVNAVNLKKVTKRIKKEYPKLESVQTTNDIDRAFNIFEGVMGDLHMIAGEAKDEDSFVKTFFKEYGDKIKKSKESEEWVRSLYKDNVKESLNEISNKNAEKYSQPLNKLKNPKKIRNIAAGRNKFDDMLVWLSHNAENLDYHLDGQGQLWVNGEDYETVRTELRESVDEKNKGLWANIHAKRKRGEKPARKGSKAYKKAKAAADKINNEELSHIKTLESFVNEDRNTKTTKELTKIFKSEFEEFPFDYYQDGKRIIINPEGFNPDGTLFDMKDDWREDIMRVVQKKKKNWHIVPNNGGGLTIHVKESVNEANKIACLECDEVNTEAKWRKNNNFCPSCKISSNGVAESVINEKKQLPKEISKHKDIPSWARYVAQQSDGEWTWYEETPTMMKWKGGGAWKQDGNQTYTGVKTDGKDWDKIPTYYYVKGGKITESVNEEKDNLYLQLHKKYAEQIKGLKAKKIKKLTDLVSVQRWSMEDREDYFDMDSNKKKELSAEYDEERKLFKKYMAKDYSVMLPKGTESLRETVNEDKKQSNDQGPIDSEAIETGLKNKAKESGVPIGLLRIIMRRGLAAWESSHRPGTTSQQWGYARVNSFLDKKEGTWGGADQDIAKKVKSGGHDKKL